MKKVKLGLVLSGGGAKGAYQLGVWSALRHLGIIDQIKMISSTSIGALNGIMMIMNEFKKCCQFWKNAQINPPSSRGWITKPLGKKNYQAIHNLKSGVYLSTKKLSQALDQVIDQDKITNSNCQLFVTCHHQITKKPTYFKINQLSITKIKKVILASASIPLIFKKQVINGQAFVDGGLSDNVPITPLYLEGCNLIIVVYLNHQPVINYQNFPNTYFIEIIPSQDIGKFRDGTLNFYQPKISALIKLGYLDAYKVLVKNLKLIKQAFI